jgi:glyoxylase-like metal-dependent hydrolase (beta-lactamase superfamily II)
MAALLATAIHDLPAGIERVSLPVPFPVGPVNCYLLVGEPLTLVDPGMVYADTVDRLAGVLARVGRRLEDVAQVVVTHGHPDHFGAAGLVASRSGATVVCGREDEAKLRLRFDPATCCGWRPTWGHRRSPPRCWARW